MAELNETEEDLQKTFLTAGKRFFEFNGSKNTPNILLKLNDTIKDSSESSEKLATALNRLTIWGIIIAGTGLVIALANLILEIFKYKNC